MKHRTLFHSYRTVATVVDTDKVSLRHLDREDLLRELLAFHRLTASIPVMPLFNFPICLRICLTNTSLRLVIPCLTKEKEKESTFREEFTRKHWKGIAFLSLKGRTGFHRTESLLTPY